MRDRHRLSKLNGRRQKSRSHDSWVFPANHRTLRRDDGNTGIMIISAQRAINVKPGPAEFARAEAFTRPGRKLWPGKGLWNVETIFTHHKGDER